MKPPHDAVPAEIAASLSQGLGNNLHSCCLYGSTVRGNAIAGVSDLNILIVLERSDAGAHAAIARVLGGRPDIDPFIVDRAGLQRTAHCFSTKFASIQRHYQVLVGADPFIGVTVNTGLEKLLCEQGLRNLRLRLTYAFVMRSAQRSYGRFLQGCVSPVFVQLSDILRLEGLDLPAEFTDRVPLLGRHLGLDAAALTALHDLRKHPRVLRENEMATWHGLLIHLLDTALSWVEAHWADPSQRLQ